ncbi:MAG: hypothetical protein IJ955_02970 [Oscillospiraceae bacterium]|nr:hypothetical protein [Oscillospiraceae bacterium]
MTESYVLNVKIGDRFVGIPVMRGENGKTPEIRLDGKVLQYRFDADGEWQTIFDFSTVETVKGDPGDTPYIGANGNWFIGDTDTGVRAQGNPGVTPHIGANGNWFTGETDTGIKAQGDAGHTPVRGTDYWTQADKTEIKSYVDEAIVNGEW